MHYDFRLEHAGVLKSWAIPKGPSLEPAQRRLAVAVTDHNLDYATFEGTLPEGQYGAGEVIVWDEGEWQPAGDVDAMLQQGKLNFSLSGHKLRGQWTLLRLGQGGKQWLLLKRQDDEARRGPEGEITQAQPKSVRSGKALTEPQPEAGKASEGQPEPHKRAKKAPAKAPAGRSAGSTGQAAFIPPQLATLVDGVPADDGWLWEVKFDGYRALGLIEGGRCRLVSRTEQDWSQKLEPLCKVLAALPCKSAFVDGEVAVVLPDGTTDFQALQNALNPQTQQLGALSYFAFDLLMLDGEDLRPLPLSRRKERLQQLLAHVDAQSPLQYSGALTGAAQELLAAACHHGLEGLIGKRAGAPYTSGRTSEWIKVKCSQRQEFVIGGYTAPKGTRADLGALLLGHYADGALQYAGKVGTGFDRAVLSDLKKRLEALQTDRSPFAGPVKEGQISWCRPELVCEVHFTQWTQDGLLRHPAFVGLREDKPAVDVHRDVAKPAPGGGRPAAAAGAADPLASSLHTRAQRRAVGEGGSEPQGGDSAPGPQAGGSEKIVEGVSITHADRVLDAQSGLSKGELAEYAAVAAPYLLRHAAQRPLMLLRCPQGHTKSCFVQRHVKGLPPSVHVAALDKTEDVPYVDDARGLVDLAQMGVMEIHTWGCLVQTPDRPDTAILDLDPGEGVHSEQLLRGIFTVRGALNGYGLHGQLKHTGGRGVHICVPLARGATWPVVSAVFRYIAQELARKHPEAFVARSDKSLRPGKIFIDYLRNARGNSAVAPYSVRARPGAPVCRPLSWRGLTAQTLEERPSVRQMLQQMRQGFRDPWQSEPIAAQELPKPLIEAASAQHSTPNQETTMPRGDKSSYTDKQKRQAEHIEEGYEKRGTPEDEAKARAWATVNAMTHGGKKSGSGRGQPEDHSAAQKGGHIGGKAGGHKGGKASGGGHKDTSSSKS